MLLHGIDFSGAASGGAAKIRVVERDLRQPQSPVRSRGRMDRRGLVRHVLEARADGDAHAFRIDAPIGLPLETLRAFAVEPNWSAMAEWLASFQDPRLWRTAVRATTRQEPKRACDHAFRAPMAPMNLRVFKQTWTLIAEVLRPLAEAGVRVEPVHRGAAASAVVVCEGCPASVLRHAGLADHGYKGQGLPPRRMRERVVQWLEQSSMRIPQRLAQEAVDDAEGDLLDALLLLTEPRQWIPPAEAAVEGWIF
jgi:hypothetical protein